MAPSSNERWLEQAGQLARQRRVTLGESAAPRERLIEILWLVSRSIRATGDLATARRYDPSFLTCARVIATNLGLYHVTSAFSGSEAGLERQFFGLFDAMCGELRESALPG
jgi:hypothetical protein